MIRPASWEVPDVIDFEYLLTTTPIDAAADRRLYADRIAPALDTQHRLDRRSVFRTWVEVLRGQAGDASPTPGRQWRHGEAVMRWAATIIGLMVGVGLAGVWLAGSGAQPVNAPLFWAVTVGVQLAWLIVVVLAWSWRRALAARWRGGALQAILGRLLTMIGSATRKLPGESRQALQATLGQMAQHRGDYGTLLTAPLLAFTQRFAVAFNAGLLFAMLALHLPLVDLRFGWQSTYPISPMQMHAAVDAAALPWRWALPALQPTADEVAATRYGGGQTADRLPAEAARAWWPFLALSIAFYGLLLRAALLAALRITQRRRLAALAFDSPQANALWRRLTGGLVAAVDGGRLQLPPLQSAPASVDAAADQAHAPASRGLDDPADTPAATGLAICRALVATELAIDEVSVQRAAASLGARVVGIDRVAVDDRTAATALMPAAAGREPIADLWLVVVSAERDPIVAIAMFLRSVASALANDRASRAGTDRQPRGAAEIVLLLVGCDEERMTIWRRFVQIQQLRIGVEAIRAEALE